MPADTPVPAPAAPPTPAAPAAPPVPAGPAPPASEGPTGAGVIATHDHRVRVFVSSTLVELADERRAARDAVTRLRLIPVMFEQGASPHPPRELYRSYLAQSDVFVGIYGESYGWVAPGTEVSGVEDEYLLSGGLPRLLYVKTPAPARDPRLGAMIERVMSGSGASTTPFRDAADLGERLADDLAVLLTERFDAARPRTARGPGALSPAPPPTPPTPLVGRERELDVVLALLRQTDVRLVTLLGPGGIGKTRLALEVAARSAALPGAPPIGFADLSALPGPAAVPDALAAALGVRTEGNRPLPDLLADRIGDRAVLLVLDNAEHVLAAAPVLADLLAACPALRLLVTSRSVLHVRGEHEVALAPLALPPSGDLDPVSVGASPAVQLFVDRARQVRADFALDETSAPVVAGIVTRLEGIPLAVELAAAGVRLLPPAALAARLGPRLDLRSEDVDRPSRQQTLRDTIAWSHDLLDLPARSLFARLSVFTGGFTLEGAEAVGSADGDVDVLQALSALVGHSLVSPDGSGASDEPRFRMLETVREYAAERLDASGERRASMLRLAGHLRSFTTLAGQGLAGGHGGQGRRWSRRVDAELDTLRSTVDWAVEQDDARLAVALTAPLTRYWWTRGLLGPMLDVADRTAALPSRDALTATEAALLLWTRGTTRVALGRSAEAAAMLDELVARVRPLGDARLLAQALFSLALTRPVGADGTGDPVPGAAAVASMLEESVRLFRAAGDDWGVALALIPLGDLALLGGDVAGARAMHEEALEHARSADDDHMRAQAHDQLALDALTALDLPTARRHLVAAADLHRELRDHEGIAYCLEGFAGVALAQGRPDLAARMSGAAARARELVGVAVWPFLRPLHARLETLLRASLPDGAFEREHAAGLRLEPLDALGTGLRETSPA